MGLRILVVIVICGPLGRRSGPEIHLVEVKDGIKREGKSLVM